MIILGIILCVVGYIVGIGIIYKIGSVLLAIGLILLLLGYLGRPAFGRRWYY